MVRGLSLETLICDSRCMIWEGVTMETVIPGRGPRGRGETVSHSPTPSLACVTACLRGHPGQFPRTDPQKHTTHTGPVGQLPHSWDEERGGKFSHTLHQT